MHQFLFYNLCFQDIYKRSIIGIVNTTFLVFNQNDIQLFPEIKTQFQSA